MSIKRETLRDIHTAVTIWLKQRIEEEVYRESLRLPKTDDARYIDDCEAPPAKRTECGDQIGTSQMPAQIHIDDLQKREELNTAKEIVDQREHHDHFKNISMGVAQQHRLELDEDGMKTLSYYIAQANVTLWEKLHSQTSISFDLSSPVDETKGKLFSEAWRDFYKVKEQSVTPKTLGKFRSAYIAFLDTVGDITLSKMKYYHAEDFALQISDYPTFRTQGEKENLSLEAVKELTDGRIKTAVMKDWCNKLGNFCKWCIKNDFLARDYFEGLAPEHKSQRRAWKPEVVPFV